MCQTSPNICSSNINNYRPSFSIEAKAIPEHAMWKIFDLAAFQKAEHSILLPIDRIISQKDESKDPKFVSGEKPDPRETAYRFMLANATNGNSPRLPIEVEALVDGNYQVIDGNATVQILMLIGWKSVPCTVTQRGNDR